MIWLFISQWGHVLAAISFGGLSVWMARRWGISRVAQTLCIASWLTVVWALVVALDGSDNVATSAIACLRDLGWLTYIHTLWRSDQRRSASDRSINLLYGVLSFVLVGRACVDLIPLVLGGSPRLLLAAFYAGISLRIITDIGALMLVHNLYTAVTTRTRDVIRLPMLALAILWGYDLNLYTIAYLANDLPDELIALRGPFVAFLAPMFALGVLRSNATSLKLSRSVTFQSLSLVAIGGYLVIMVLGSVLLRIAGPNYVRFFQVSFVFITTLIGIVTLPNERLRALVRVMLSKHFFQHRYDYRAEWIRFTETLGRPDINAAGLNVRIIKAIADITESSRGLLLVPDVTGGLICAANWNWADCEVPARAADHEMISYFTATSRIFEFDSVRSNRASDEEARIIPQWLISNMRAWVAVPLLHFDRLEGLVILDRPLVDRPLDWEDFDLLRVVGRQVASYLAEAKSQETLSDVQRFDEFNRRFAFIMHDIKNLVSQLSLVTRNAERHISNPEFQRDMLGTLHNSTKRMNDLLERLSQHNNGRTEDPRPTPLSSVINAVIAPRRTLHPIVVAGDNDLFAMVDATRLEQALGHIVQNAIDASGPSDPVTITASLKSSIPQISIGDTGQGMSAEFMRTQLFKPFASTKDNGFGIGAYEARQLILGMGGQLDVKSHRGDGTTFTISLPPTTDCVSAKDIAA